MLFSQIPGLVGIKKQLIESVRQSHVAHAQLFAGKEGSANLAMALAFSTYLNCENPGEEDACGICPSCQKNLKFIHPDVNFVFPTSATTRFKREDATSEKFLVEWRVFLQKSIYGNVADWASDFGWENKQLIIPRQESRNIVKALSLKAFEGKYKVMIIWLPETMNVNAANGILKILEEPPKHTIFLLVSNAPNLLLTTITSRTQKVNIPSFGDDDIFNVAKSLENNQVTDDRASQIAYMSEGNMRLALELVHEDDNETDDFFKNWMRQCFTYNFSQLVQLADEFQKKGKAFQKELLDSSSKTLRETLIATQNVDSLSRVPDSEIDFINKFSVVFSADKIMKVVPRISEAYYHIERNANPKILFLDLSLAIAKIARS